ncbi:MAG: histidine phosphatase family protein [Paracoccaceae bacterium]
MIDRREAMAGALALGLAGRAAAQGLPDLAAGSRRHLIMRHALAPGYSDPAGFEIDDCSTQRNLDDRGRAQARETGERLAEAGVAVDRVLSSRWCRCLDTARLLNLGPVEEAEPLDSFFEARERRDAQTEALKALLLGLEPSVACMLVTHQVNVSALIGRSATSGEVYAFEIDGDGTTRVLGELLVPA